MRKVSSNVGNTYTSTSTRNVLMKSVVDAQIESLSYKTPTKYRHFLATIVVIHIE